MKPEMSKHEVQTVVVPRVKSLADAIEATIETHTAPNPDHRDADALTAISVVTAKLIARKSRPFGDYRARKASEGISVFVLGLSMLMPLFLHDPNADVALTATDEPEVAAARKRAN